MVRFANIYTLLNKYGFLKSSLVTIPTYLICCNDDYHLTPLVDKMYSWSLDYNHDTSVIVILQCYIDLYCYNKQYYLYPKVVLQPSNYYVVVETKGKIHYRFCSYIKTLLVSKTWF